MKSKSILLLLFLITICSFYGRTQKSFVKNDKQWFQYYHVLKLNKRFLLKTDAGFRWENAFQNNSQYILRTGLGLRVGKKSSLTVGFAHLGFFKEDTLSKLEFRPYEEINMVGIHNRLKLQHRFRIEQRIFQTISTDNFSFNFRFRYRIFMSYSLREKDKGDRKSEILLNFGDEIFLNAGKDIIYNVFDQNRILLGLTYKLDGLAISGTYSKEVGAFNYPNSFRNNDIFWLGIKHRINLKRS